MGTPRQLVIVEVRPGVFMRFTPEEAAKYNVVKTTDEPAAAKKKTPAKNKKAAQYDTKGE